MKILMIGDVVAKPGRLAVLERIQDIREQHDIDLAMIRGETQGRANIGWFGIKTRNTEWLRDGKIRMLIQIGLARNARMGDVPFVMDFAKTEDERGVLRLIFGWTIMGRPFLAPPGVPEDRRAALVKAFDETMRDPAFLDEAGKQRLEIAPISGATRRRLSA